MKCNVCESNHVESACNLPLKISNGIISTEIIKCRSCGSYFRAENFNAPQIQSHYDVIDYTLPQQETHYYNRRINFFSYLFHLVKHCANVCGNNEMKVLDVGCSYGHMMKLFKKNGADIEGVEIVERLRNSLQTQGYTIYESIEDIPEENKFDAVTFIDSLYYFEDPKKILTAIRGHIKPDGIVLLRITNRTPILNLCRALKISITHSIFGDSKYSFSHRGIKKLAKNCGYKITKTLYAEKGKKKPFGIKWFYYKLAPMVSCLSRIKLSPGLIIIMKMNPCGHPLEGFCQAKKILHSKKSQIFCLIK